MPQVENTARQYCYVEFSIADHAAFDRLQSVVSELGRQKDSECQQDDEFWLRYFLEGDRKEFWWPSESEAEMWNTFWFSTPVEQRLSFAMPTPPWDFGSMVEVILTSEYDLVGVRMLDDGIGRLEIDPHGFPYGGIDSLRALVRAFGHRIIGSDDGTGFVPGDEQPPRWTPDMKPLKLRTGFWHRLFGKA
ncbi:MAG: hypothetical protein H6918_03940 [Sphingomonadaceae bacterium]|nr:hypothetical protein [Sphingomonadaceae bacterium]